MTHQPKDPAILSDPLAQAWRRGDLSGGEVMTPQAMTTTNDIADTKQEELIERIADEIECAFGPLFGSPEYLADPVKLARAEKRRRDKCVSDARIALRATLSALQQPDERDAEIARRLESAEFALAYLASCTAATVENMLDRKSTPKSELSRHESILGMLDKAMRGERLKTHYSSTAIIGAETRVKKTLERVRNALQRNRKEP